MGSEEVSSLNWGTTSPKAQSKSGHSFPNDLLLSHNNTLGSSSAHSSSKGSSRPDILVFFHGA